MKSRWIRRGFAQVLAVALLICLVPDLSFGYSVLTHEAIIDSMWEKDITPVLKKRFPSATADELRDAHGFAYGGAIIQDMGYYPFGSRTYSDLAHYVRTGAFVEALLRDAADVKEYAFAVGALSHYWADNGGHALATNVSVPLLYPKLQQRFGPRVTYEDNPSAHIQTEFGFDVLQVAQGHYASQSYHDFIGFQVANRLFEQAFQETYGIELKGLFTNFGLAVGTYRHTVSTLIPTFTRVAWESTKGDLEKNHLAEKSTVSKDSAVAEGDKHSQSITREKFLYNLSKSDYAKEWGDQYQKPSFFDRILAFLIRVMPKIGPFKNFDIKPSTHETELLFMRGFDSTTVAYRRALVRLRAGELTLEDRNLDTGTPTKRGEYKLADESYSRLLHTLAADKFQGVTPPLRADIITFYRDTTMRTGTRKDSLAWNKTLGDLRALRSATAAP